MRWALDWGLGIERIRLITNCSQSRAGGRDSVRRTRWHRDGGATVYRSLRTSPSLSVSSFITKALPRLSASLWKYVLLGSIRRWSIFFWMGEKLYFFPSSPGNSGDELDLEDLALLNSCLSLVKGHGECLLLWSQPKVVGRGRGVPIVFY